MNSQLPPIAADNSVAALPLVQPTQLWHLIYLSVARRPFSLEELKQLLHKARIKNHSLDVTGMLIYRDRCFVQVLEGPRAVVENLFHVIGRDPRHGDVGIMLSGQISDRSFGDWRMGFVDAQNGEMPPGFTDFFGESFTPGLFAQNAGFARRMLLAFRDTKWRRFVDEA